MASEDSGNSLIAFIVGAVAGATLGILFAPKAGKDTREQIGDWLKERREDGSELLAKVAKMKDEGLHKAKEAISSLKA